MILIDASVAFKWFMREEDSDLAERLLVENDLAAPELLLSETGNALWKAVRRKILPAEQVYILVEGLAARFVQLYPLETLIVRALEIAMKLDHPVYDCIYLANAEDMDLPLITADRKLLQKIRMSEFSSLAVSIEETRA